MIDIFINYRSSDEPFAALLIDKALSGRLGSGRVFRDSRTIRPGIHFPPEIWSALQQCRVLVAVIGQRWLRPGPDGQRRIDDPTDYVRREIAEALRRDVLVVPVLVGETPLPTERDELPPDIAGISSRQYLHLRVRNAEYDVLRLANEFDDLLDCGVRPATEYGDHIEPSANVTNNFHQPVHAPESNFGIKFGR